MKSWVCNDAWIWLLLKHWHQCDTRTRWNIFSRDLSIKSIMFDCSHCSCRTVIVSAIYSNTMKHIQQSFINQINHVDCSHCSCRTVIVSAISHFSYTSVGSDSMKSAMQQDIWHSRLLLPCCSSCFTGTWAGWQGLETKFGALVATKKTPGVSFKAYMIVLESLRYVGTIDMKYKYILYIGISLGPSMVPYV